MDKKEKPPENPPAQDTAEGPTEHVGAGTVRATDAEHKGTDRWTTTGVQQDTIRQGRQLPAVPGQTQQPTGSRMAPPIKPPLFQVKTLKKVHLPAKPGSSDSDKAQTASDKGNSTTSTTDIVGQTATNKGTRTRDDNTENISMSGQGSEARQNMYKSNLATKTFVSDRRNVFTDQSADHQKQDVSRSTVKKRADRGDHGTRHSTEQEPTIHTGDDEVIASKQSAENRDAPHDNVGHQGDRREHQETDDNDGQSSVLTAGDTSMTPKQDKQKGTSARMDNRDESPDEQNLERQLSGQSSTREVTNTKQDKPEVEHDMDESPDVQNLERQPSGHTRTKDDKVTNPKQATDICAPMREGINKQQHQRNPDSTEPLKRSVKQTEDPTSEPSVPQETSSDTNADIDKGTGEVVGDAECGDGDDKGTHASNDPVTGQNDESIEKNLADALKPVENNSAKEEIDDVKTDENEDSDSSWDKLDEDNEGNLTLTTDKSGAVSIQPPVISMVTEREKRSSTNDSKPNKISSIANAKVIHMTVASIWILVVNDKKMSLRRGIKEARCENGFLVLDDNELYEIDLVNGDIVLKPIKEVGAGDKQNQKQMESETSKDTANIVSVKESNIEPSVRTSDEVENKTTLDTEYNNENKKEDLSGDGSRNPVNHDEKAASILTDIFTKMTFTDTGETAQDSTQICQNESQSKTNHLRSEERNVAENMPPLPPKSNERGTIQDPIQQPSAAPSVPPRQKKQADKSSPTSQHERSSDHGPSEVYRGASGSPTTKPNSSGSATILEVTNKQKELEVNVKYKDNSTDVTSLEVDIEKYMKLKCVLNNERWMFERQRMINEQKHGIALEYQKRTGIITVSLDINRPQVLEKSIFDDVVAIILDNTEELFVNSIPVNGLDKIQVVRKINENYLVRDGDLYVECDEDLDYVYYVFPNNVQKLVDVLIQSFGKTTPETYKCLKFDMVFSEILKNSSTLQRIRSEKNRQIKVSFYDESGDVFVCVLQGCNDDVSWAENLINTEIFEGHGFASFKIKDIKHCDEFESLEMSDLVEETLQNKKDRYIVDHHFNRNGTISVCGSTQGNVDKYVTSIKQLLKSKSIPIENKAISRTKLKKYIEEVQSTVDARIIITILGDDQLTVNCVGLKDTIEMAENMLLEKINPIKDKATKFKVTESENKKTYKDNNGSGLTCMNKQIWIKYREVFTHICAKENLPKLAKMHGIQPSKLEVKKTETWQGFFVTGGIHQFDKLKEYINQYGCEDIALTFNNSEKIPEVLNEVERKHNVTLNVEDTPNQSEKEGAIGGSTDATPMAGAVAGKEVDRTEWDFPGGHRLMVINDDANNCWQDLMVDINIGEKQSSEARIYDTDQGKKKTSVHIMQWDGGEKKENDALLQEFERMLKLAQAYDCIDICIPITPVGMWPNRKYIKRMLYAINNHLKNPDMLTVKVQLCTTDVTLYKECCVAAKDFLPGSVEKKKRKTKTKGESHEMKVKRQLIAVNVIRGQLDESKANIIVNTTSHELQLDQGRVSKALLDKAGKSLQQECSRNHRGKIKSGEIVVTKGYMLQCDHVFHSALDRYNGSAVSIGNLVMECLKRAAAMKCKSIAFPAIGTGNLSYPIQEVAAAMFEAVHRFEQTYNGSSVEQVDFVIYRGDQEAVGIFNEYQQKYYKQKGASCYNQNESTTMRLGRINVKARLGTLDNCTTEAIVYLWTKGDFHNAKYGDHCLLKKVGKDVQKKFDDHTKLDGAAKYEVFSTTGGNTQIPVIIHAPCEDNKDSIAKAFMDSILLLDQKKMKTASVWFPAQHPLLKHGAKLPDSIVAAVKDIQQSVVCLSEICIVVEGKHNLPKIFQYFRIDDVKKTVTIKIIGKAEEIKLAKETLQHYIATGNFGNMPKYEKPRSSSPVEQTIQRYIEDDTTAGALGQKPESLDTYVKIENIPLDYTLEKLRSALVLVKGFPIAPPRFVYMDGSTKGIAICNSKQDASRLVKFKGIPGIRFKPHPKMLIEPTCTIKCDKTNKQSIMDQLQNIHVTINEKGDNQLLIVAQTTYQLKQAEQICFSASAYRERHESEFMQYEPINVVSEIWEIVKIVKNENLKVLENNTNVKVDFKDNVVNIEWSGAVGDDDEIRSNVEVLNAYCRSLQRKEIEEIQLDSYDADETQKWCNDVEETLRISCCLYIPKQNKVFAYCDTYDDIQKVKHQFLVKEGKVKPTARRKRNIAVEEQSVGSGNTDNRRAHREDRTEFCGVKHNDKNKPDIQFNWNEDAKNVKEYKTREGIVVKVYEASIVKLPVDCIVNAANDTLQHGGGIARVIEKAAGYELTREGNTYIKENGPIPVGFEYTTTAGKLPYRCVIHAVGPRWTDYRPHDLQKVKEVEDLLHSAILNSFHKAEARKLDSIAVPAISAAIFAVPEELCVYQYARAIVDYSKKSVTAIRPLREIHFIDINPSIIWKIQKMFKVMIPDGTYPNYDTKNFVTSHQSASKSKWYKTELDTNTAGNRRSTSYEDAPAAIGNPNYTEHNIDNVPLITVTDTKHVSIFTFGMTTLRVHVKGMFKVKANAIVSIENKTGTGSGTLAYDIQNRIKDSYKKKKYLDEKKNIFPSHMPLNLGDTPISTGKGSGYDYVVHAVLPYSDLILTQADQRKHLIIKTYDNILAAVDENVVITSVVMPLIGTGDAEKELRCAARAFVDSFTVFCNKRNKHANKHLDVHLVLRTAKARDIVYNFLKHHASTSTTTKDNPTPPERPPQPTIRRQTSTTEDPLSAGSNDQTEKDSCVICMDDITAPETLKCGHVFCKECIEQQFKHKKACPTCGALCGTITGDQPSGTMTITTSHYSQCAGYRGCGCITIEYEFPSGQQEANHQSPGKYYKGIKRTAYLPDNHEGRQICAMLKVAFDRKLVFTIGNSRTTGQEGVITWNDIHHKTDHRPNTQFGYPDPTYLVRVKDELAAKGVTEKDISKK